jgi:hypothetical protein
MKVSGVTAGCVLFKNREVSLFALQEAGQPGSTLAVRLGPKWHTYDPIAWTAIALAAAKDPSQSDWRIIAMGNRGQIWELTPGQNEVTQSVIPGDHELTALASIEGVVWACGMDRVALRREVDGTWTDVSAPAAQGGVLGFTAMAGTAASMLAVGWGGEIWRYRGAWEREPALATANLNALSIGATETLVVGDGGCLLAYRDGAWTVREAPNLDLTAVCHHGDDVFVGSTRGLFRMVEGRLEPETRFVDDAPASVAQLVSGTESAFLLNERDVYQFIDSAWNQLV